MRNHSTDCLDDRLIIIEACAGGCEAVCWLCVSSDDITREIFFPFGIDELAARLERIHEDSEAGL